MELPKETGFYLWYILDWGYFKVGAVQILRDPDSHIQRLKETLWEDRKGFYIHQEYNLTIYHQAHDNLPPCNKDGKPLVDGWIPFDFRTVGLVKEPPIKLEGKAMPKASPESLAKLKEKSVPPEDATSKFKIGDTVRVKPELAEISVEGVVANIIWNEGFHCYFHKRWEKESNLEKVKLGRDG